MSKEMTYLVPFYGDGAFQETGKDTMLVITGISEYPRDVNGTCAYCHGDPGAESSPPESLIAKFYKWNSSWAETCPCCNGRPT